MTEAQILESIRKICVPFAGTEEKLSHGHPAFATKKGIYAVLEMLDARTTRVQRSAARLERDR